MIEAIKEIGEYFREQGENPFVENPNKSGCYKHCLFVVLKEEKVIIQMAQKG